MQKLWRADTLTEKVTYVENVEDSAPVGVWMMPMVGDGYYRYEVDEESAKEFLAEQLGFAKKEEENEIINRGMAALNRSEVRRLCMHEPTLKNAFANGESSGHTYEQILETIILSLIQQKNNLYESLTRLVEERQPNE